MKEMTMLMGTGRAGPSRKI